MASSKKEEKIKELLGETAEEKKEDTSTDYYTVGKLREQLKDLDDNIPVVTAPLNENIKVALNLIISDNVELEKYKGKMAIFDVRLFDIKTDKEIELTPENK